MYFCRTSFQLAGGEDSGFGGAVSWGIPPAWGDSRGGTCHPNLGCPGEGQDSHPSTTTFLRVSSLRKCLTRL